MQEAFHRRTFMALPLDHAECLVRLAGQTETARMSSATAKVLSKAPTFGTLQHYVEHFAGPTTLSPARATELGRAFAELVRQGVFLSSAELVQRLVALRAADEPIRPITSFATLTRNRPQALQRCVRSYAEHARARGRTLRFSVVDSSEPQQGAENQRLLATLGQELDVEVGYAGPAEKAAFAAELAKQSGLELGLLEFALLDPEHVGSDTGSNRNALWLAHVGEVFFSADDDTICTLRAPAEPPGAALTLSSAHDPTRVWLQGASASEASVARPTDACLWEAHERLTSRRVADCVADHTSHLVRVEALGEKVLELLLTGTPKIAASMSGFVGDCGASSPAFHLWRSDVRRQLPSTRHEYDALASERGVMRSPLVATVGTGGFLMTTAYSVDATELAPPFLPVLRGEDHLFATLLRRCFPEKFLAYVPCCVAHEPVTARRFAQGGTRLPMKAMTFLNVVQAAIALCPAQSSASGAPRLSQLGRQLAELAQLPWPELEQALATRVWRDMERQMGAYEKELGQVDPKSPWAEDLRGYQKQLALILEQPDFLVPEPLREGLPIEHARALLQRLLARFGELLTVWPSVVQAAAQLKAQGISMFRQPLES